VKEPGAANALQQAIASIWLKHRELVFERLRTIEAAVRAHAQGDLDPELRAAAHRDAHKLAGALGTFGLHDGTTHARTIEIALGDGSVDVADLELAARGLRTALESQDVRPYPEPIGGPE
jgi:HPt (histidine-containing phosphotransfer) domain-containing protein